MRNGIGPILGRIFGVVASLLLLGIMLRLVTALLAPVLPAELMQMLTSGWQLLFGLVRRGMGAHRGRTHRMCAVLGRTRPALLRLQLSREA